jgi:hypothetical protein
MCSQRKLKECKKNQRLKMLLLKIWQKYHPIKLGPKACFEVEEIEAGGIEDKSHREQQYVHLLEMKSKPT